MRFKQILAQETAIRILQRALNSKKVHHAYLFAGPEGVGKRLAARALAMALNCEIGGDDPCCECISCRKVLKNNHPDVFELSLPEGKKRIPIEKVRETSGRLAIPAYEGKAKVAIIDPADQMSDQAANALLKTLEEPRSGSFMILITSKASSMLPTIRSRCQLIRFRPLPDEIIARILGEQGIEAGQAASVSAFAAGSMAQAEFYLGDQLDGRLASVFALIDGAFSRTPLDGLQAAELLRRDRPEVLAVLDLLAVVVEELLWINTHDDENPNERVLVKRLGNRLSSIAQRTTVTKIADLMTAIESARGKITQNNMNPQLALEGMLMTIRGRA